MRAATDEDEAADGHEKAALGPVVVTARELGQLEAAHRRLLGEPRPSTHGEAGVPAAEAADREARHSLVARGLLDADGELPEGDDVALLVTTVLDVRHASERVLVVERMVAGGGTPDGLHGLRLVHLVDHGACVEDLLPDGSHHLYLVLERNEVVTWVTDVMVPPDACAATGPALPVLSGRPEAMAAALGHPSVLAELALLRPAGRLPAGGESARPVHHLVAMGPSGCWVGEVDPGRPLPGTVDFEPVRPVWVEEWVRAALDEAAVDARSSDGRR